MLVAARDGADALQVWRRNRDRIDAVVTDVRLPDMDGRELASLLRADDPGLGVLLMSGYAPGDGTGEEPGREPLLQKPFTSGALADALAAELRGRPRRGD